LQNAGIVPTQLANPNLKWEKTRELNLGLDLGFLEDRFGITANYFIRTTNDLLLDRPLPLTSGFRTITENIGSIENRGLELDLTSRNINKESFTWTTNFNIAFIRNKVLSLYEDNAFPTGFASWVAVGSPLGSFYGYQVDGIFQSQDEIAAGPTHSSATRPGDIRFKDLDSDGRITGADQSIIGSAQPDFYGGITNNLTFKGFDLSFFFQFVSGNEIYNNTRAFAEGMNGQFGQLATVRNRWTPENTNTTMPRAIAGDPNNNRRVSDRWLEDGSFIRLKNASLGYNVPTTLLEKVRVRALRVYVASQNLLTFTNYSGLDPEINTFSGSNTSLGTDFLVFPQARTITFGANLGF
jgi:TonB-linked SusC/RagA family outer membrane protein